MLVKDVMCKKPQYLSPETPLKKIAEEMKKHDCGFIPIGDGKRLLGTVTDRDIALRAVAAGKDPSKTTASEIMTEKVFYVFEDDDLEKAAKSMEKKQIRRLIVLDKNKQMTGILALGDISTKSKDMNLSGEIIKEVSETRH